MAVIDRLNVFDSVPWSFASGPVSSGVTVAVRGRVNVDSAP